MVEQDLAYLRSLIADGIIAGSVLEVGSHDHNGNAKQTCAVAGLSWEGADWEPGPGVDYVVDILDAPTVTAIGRQWDSVLVLNLLEHVYDPITALRHCVQLTKPGGVCVVVGPVVWQLHDYPADYWRPLPDFFTEFSRRQRCEVVPGTSRWLLNKESRMIPVEALYVGDQKKLPGKDVAERVYGRPRALSSRVVHYLLHTIGRDTYFPYVGLGVVIRKLP